MPTKESEQKLDSIVTDFLYILISSKWPHVPKILILFLRDMQIRWLMTAL
jgi:hypothetical protein